MIDTSSTDEDLVDTAASNAFDELDAVGVLDALTDAVAGRERFEVDKLELALVWADLHGVVASLTDARGRTVSGGDCLVRPGGEGTPEVSEFSIAEFAAVAGTSTGGGMYLIGDALELRHRLPLIWARVRAGHCTVARAKQVTRLTRAHNEETAAYVDRHLENVLGRQTSKSAETLAAAAIIAADPAAAAEREKARRSEHGVFAHRADKDLDLTGDAATRSATVRTNVRDMTWFLAGVDRMAQALKLLGDDRSEGERRGAAVGVLADPDAAQDIYRQVRELSPDDTPDDPDGLPADPDIDGPGPDRAPASMSGGGRVQWQTLLYVHMTLEQLRSGDGVARIEDQGPVAVQTAIDLLSAGAAQGAAPRIVVKPVIDLNDGTGVDAYEIPDRIREIVHLRSPRDYFPYGSNTSRTMDLDHITAWKADPPPDGEAQTGPDKLAPLSRQHHRMKTLGGWQPIQVAPGIVIWRSPHGYEFLVDHTGTRPLT